MASHTIVTVPGAGDPAHPESSRHLFAWLASELGDEYRVLTPAMPAPEEPHYRPWRDRIDEELRSVEGEVALLGHSFGGSVLLKYLAEGPPPVPIRALFLASVPYWGPSGWQYDEYDLPEGLATSLPPAPLFLYHSREDPEVPFSHLGRYAAVLPQATVREIAGAQHSFTGGLPELVADIRQSHAA